jgi:hypothetical protein
MKGHRATRVIRVNVQNSTHDNARMAKSTSASHNYPVAEPLQSKGISIHRCRFIALVCIRVVELVRDLFWINFFYANLQPRLDLMFVRFSSTYLEIC